ncbi:MAG: hypothetical protein JXN61_12725 [Sedimentisphaerales bacterium]|nr:hypothetical protein [Sedimentisphaerales bacterium]
MANQDKQNNLQHLPPSALVFISRVIRKMRYRKKVRQDVQTELVAHFEDGLKDCTADQEKEQAARKLIAEFGDIKLLALLLRRAKKRCRPLWRTVVARTLQTVGGLLVCLILYTIWFATGKPAPSIDYVEVFNRMNRPELRNDDNAWPDYEKAVGLFVKPQEDDFYNNAGSLDHEFAALDPCEQSRTIQWVEENGSAWRQFAAGSAKPYCYRKYACDPNDEEQWLLGIQLTHLSDLRDIARLGVWRSRIAADRGRLADALDTCIAIARAGSHWQGKGTLIEQLVGISMVRIAQEQILALIDTSDIPAELLEKSQDRLSKIYPDGYPIMDVRGERLMFMDTVQHIFTGHGLGGGHLIPNRLSMVGDLGFDSDSHQNTTARMLELSACAAASMAHARREKTVAKANELYDTFERRATMTPYQKRLAEVPSADDILNSLSHYRYSFLHMMCPAIDRIAELGFRARTGHQATLTILAFKRWQAQKGSYPATLNDLVSAGLLQELPSDPYSDKPLVYRLTADGFTLYSLGPDFEDQAGATGKDRDGHPKAWVDDGDTVFWPVLKAETRPKSN